MVRHRLHAETNFRSVNENWAKKMRVVSDAVLVVSSFFTLRDQRRRTTCRALLMFVLVFMLMVVYLIPMVVPVVVKLLL